MKEYAIALKNLNLDNNIINNIIVKYSEQELKDVFYNKDSSIFSNDLELFKYRELFENNKILDEALKKALHILEENKKYNIRTLLYTNRNYPANLRDIDNPPPILYIKGANYKKAFSKAFACVGTRVPTKFAVNATNYLIPQWVNEDFVIVSGLALGVDTLSHIACLESGGITIAVMAHGLDMIYPKENIELANRILNNKGLLVSEYPIGTKPDKFRFVQRNRLIVGLARGTIVFESKLKSGTMHSVEYTIKQNKLVFCPNPGDGKIDIQQEGLRYLINSNKAIVIENGVSFEVPIFALGYKLKSSPLRLNKIKENYVHALLSNISSKSSVDQIFIDINNKDQFKRKSISVNSVNYEEFKDIAEKNHVTVKELINVLIEQIVISNKKT